MSDYAKIRDYLEQKGYGPNEAARQARIIETKIEAIQAEASLRRLPGMVDIRLPASPHNGLVKGENENLR